MIVDRDGVTVVMPQRTPEWRADEAVARLEDWIRAQLAERSESLAKVRSRGMTLPWLDEVLAIEPEPGRKSARRDGQRVLVPEGDYRPALERLIRRAAKDEVSDRLDRVTAACNHTWTSLRIGDMKTRWASYTPGGRLSFSWRLMLAPERVLETVVWHEVTHMDVQDHSPRFWNLMDERRPGHREDHQWLRDHGRELAL